MLKVMELADLKRMTVLRNRYGRHQKYQNNTGAGKEPPTEDVSRFSLERF
jgi:hypothetical protein